jgi:hypothetical protein
MIEVQGAVMLRDRNDGRKHRFGGVEVWSRGCAGW